MLFYIGGFIMKRLNSIVYGMCGVVVAFVLIGCPDAPTTPPSAPTNLRAIAGEQRIVLSWNGADRASEYRIYRGIDPEARIRTTTTPNPLTTTTYTDINLTNGITYTYTVRAVNSHGESGDSAEITATLGDYGNTPATATPVTAGSSTSGRIHVGDDEDFFSVQVLAGQILRARTEGSTDTRGTILSASEIMLRFNDDIDTTTNKNFDVYYVANTDGTYYIKVDSFSTRTGDYVLIVSTETPAADDHGNTIGTATVVTSGSATSGRIGSVHDDDFFSIQVPAGQTIRAYTTGSGVIDVVGTLLSASEEALASNDDGGLGGNFDFSYTSVSGTADTYYIRIDGFRVAAGDYTLMVSVR